MPSFLDGIFLFSAQLRITLTQLFIKNRNELLDLHDASTLKLSLKKTSLVHTLWDQYPVWFLYQTFTPAELLKTKKIY